MKIIHTSDLHIDSALTAHLSPQRARERRVELAMNLGRLIDRATEEGAVGIIIAGDLFDTQAPTKDVTERVLYSIKKARNLSFFYLCGNHERNALMQSGVPFPENLFIFKEGWTYFTLGEITLAGRSTTSEDMFKELSIKNESTVIVLHGELTDKSAPGGMIGRRELGESGARYVALGHYHSYSASKLSNVCHAVYSGTPEGRGFDETGKKGYVTVDFERGAFSYKFTEFAKRTLHNIKIDISEVTRAYEIDDKIQESTSHIPSSDMVRITFEGARRPMILEDAGVYLTRHSHRFFHLDITDTTHLTLRGTDVLTEGSVAGEFVRRVMADSALPEDDKERIIECGLSAMEINL